MLKRLLKRGFQVTCRRPEANPRTPRLSYRTLVYRAARNRYQRTNFNFNAKYFLFASAAALSTPELGSLENNTNSSSDNVNNFTTNANMPKRGSTKTSSSSSRSSNKSNPNNGTPNGLNQDMNTIIFGSGEYVTGYTGTAGVKSDKSFGVVGVVCFDLRERGLIGPKIAICGTNGNKFDGIRKHWDNTIMKLYPATFPTKASLEFTQYPKKGTVNPEEYKKAIKEFCKPGDICMVFTPDDTHFDIVCEAIDAGLHVLATKPLVFTLNEHLYLVEKAKEKGVLLQIEVHKRFDPIYNDAVQRMKGDLGEFNYFVAYMSQPSFQLDTFRKWAGISSDISYYLNSHHIDLHVWAMQGKGRCVRVNAMSSSNSTACNILKRPCDDTITINALWQSNNRNKVTGKYSTGHASYTASWTAMKSDVHSQQRFFALWEKGEINIDQCHRGYTFAGSDGKGVNSLNPLYIRNTPDVEGHYVNQNTYGYRSFEEFVKAAKMVNDGIKRPEDFDATLPTGKSTVLVTGILEAGKISLENGGKNVLLKYDGNDNLVGFEVEK